MSWTSLGLIPTAKDWSYSEPFEGDYVRIRHLLGTAQDDLPYGFTGLIAQAFDFTNTVELYNIRKLYPFNQEDIFPVINPFPGQSRRLAIRGQRKYQTKINWRVVVDVWNDDQSFSCRGLYDRMDEIEAKIDLLLDSQNEGGGDSEPQPNPQPEPEPNPQPEPTPEPESESEPVESIILTDMETSFILFN